MKEKRVVKRSFFAGLILGIIIMSFGRSILLDQTGLLEKEVLLQAISVSPDKNALFAYVFRKRIGMAFFMAILSTTYLGMVTAVAESLWLGVLTGGFVTAMVLRYGLGGLLLVFAAMFPQYLLYAPAIYTLLLFCMENTRILYGMRNTYMANKHISNKQITNTKAPILARRVLFFVWILIFLIVGCFLESHLNPIIMRKILML